ncbi:MAG: histone-lysine N-methyltransferase [Deltaproteobacteria bacterium]|nr:histone-lysine N-methyltransferase [Deltaproteobacteria bacterium]
MAKWDNRRRVLARRHSDFWKHQLQNVAEPNLMREVFPYDEVPKIDFDFMLVDINPADTLLITDTTFRDGQQARAPYTVKQIEDIFGMLHRLGGQRGLIRQSEFFLYSRKDREAVEACLAKGYRYPSVTAWIRANVEDLELVRQMGLKETGILTSVSDYHIFLKLGSDRKKIMDQYLTIVKAALNKGIAPRCHFEDVTRASIFGFCVPFALELMKLREESGIDIKIRLCDTLGLGVTYPGAAMPRSVCKVVRAMIDDAGVPGRLLEWHGHNDFHKALINASTAWLYGCSGVNGTLLGFGERTGNTPIEALVIEYLGLTGRTEDVDLSVITEIGEYFSKVLGYHIPPNYPFVGNDFNATSAGIHADGLVKNEEIYNIFNTEKLLNKPVTIILTNSSGKAGVAHWVNSRLKLAGDQKLDKRHPGIDKIYKWIMQQYEDGRNTSISNEEMEHISRRYLPEHFVSEFDLLKQKVRDQAAHLVEQLLEIPEIRSMDPNHQEPMLQKFLEQNPFIQFIYLTDQNGIKITKNITQIYDRAKYETFQLGEDLSNRSWFIEPMQDGRIHVSDFYTSRFTKALCITVSGPVRNAEDEIVGVLGADIRFEDIAKMDNSPDL